MSDADSGNTLAQLTQVLAQRCSSQQLINRCSRLIDQLRPKTEQLVHAIHNWQSEQEVSVALAEVSKVVQQVEHKHLILVV